MKSQRETVEDAIIEEIAEKLLQSRNASSGYLGMIGAYNGELEPDPDALEDFRRRIMGQFPAVLVAAGSSPINAEGASRKRYSRDLTVELYIASNNLRSREHRNRNDPQLEINATRDPGIYMIVEHIHSILAGNDFGLDGIGPGTPLREEPIIQLDEFTVWRVIFSYRNDAHAEPWSAGDGQKLTAYYLKSQLAEHPADDPPNPLVESEGEIPE